jgi:fucose permease
MNIFSKRASNLTAGPSLRHVRAHFQPRSLYRFSYNIVLQKQGAMLYNGVRTEIQSHMQTIAAAVKGLSGQQLLQTLSVQWMQHTKIMQMLSDILMYMVRFA